MKYFFQSMITVIFLIATTNSNAQAPVTPVVKKFDSTLKIGKAGYQVYCNNKGADKNELSIKPVGFENTAHEMAFYVKGKLLKAEIDDVNGDGFPDVLMYVYSGVDNAFGSVYAISSVENKSCVPIYFPDILDDDKLKIGYKGHDEYSLIEGAIMRRFPIYNTTDSTVATGGKRVVQYQAVNSDKGLKFKVIRSYEVK